MGHPLMNLVNTTLPQKYGDPQLKVSIYGSVLKCSLYNPVIWPNFAQIWAKIKPLYRSHENTFWLFPTFKEVDVEEDDNRPREVPIFDQTMSLLQMIKDKKVCLLLNFPDFWSWALWRSLKLSPRKSVLLISNPSKKAITWLEPLQNTMLTKKCSTSFLLVEE